jgi:PPOX class probable F420-dependent enzyme
VCFALVEADDGSARLYTPLDEKPKLVADPRLLARVRDISTRPEVTLLADRWTEDWDNLAWLRLEGRATLLEPGPEQGSGKEHASAVAALRARYVQYSAHDLPNRPIIRVDLIRARSWGSI